MEQKGKELEDKQRSKRPQELEQGGTIIAEQIKPLLDKRQKRIKLADSSEASWDAAQQYEWQHIASDDEDDNKIRNARAATKKKKEKKQIESERREQNSKKRCTTPNRGTADHHLSCGICIAFCFYCAFFLLFSQVVCFLLVLYWLLVSYQPNLTVVVVLGKLAVTV